MSGVIGVMVGLLLGGFAGFMFGWNVGWENGWDDSIECTYKALNCLSDTDVLRVVRQREKDGK